MAHDRSGQRRSGVAGLMVLALLGAVLAGCGHSGSAGIGRLTVDGQSQFTPAQGRAQPASTGQILKAGDQVLVVAGTATIRLDPNGLLELRAGSHVTVDKVPRVTDGSVLIEPEKRSLAVAAGTSTLVVPSGVAQISWVAGDLTAKVYQATSTLEIPGNPQLVVAAPRQAVLNISSLLPISATPLSYADGDSWDRRYLATVESFARQLGAAATGFDAQLAPGQGRDPAFFQQLVPALAQRPDFVSAYQVLQNMQPLGAVPSSSPGDYLIASVIALHGTRATFPQRLHDELVFKAQTADWGLVAYDQGVTDLLGVLNDVLAAIGRATLPFGSAQVTVTPPGSPPIATGPGPPSKPTTTTTLATSRVPAQPRQQATTTTTSPGPGIVIQLPKLPPTGTPLDHILNPLLNPLIDALNAILAGRH